MKEKEPNMYENQQNKEPYKSDEVIIVNKGRGKRVEFKPIENKEKANPEKIDQEKKKLEKAYREDNKDKWEIVNGKFKKVA